MTKIARFADVKDPTDKNKFTYKHADGTPVKDKVVLDWILSLRIPPAWVNVVINYGGTTKQTCCGYDPAGRMQCLYSTKHIESARSKKYCDLIVFGEKLPAITGDIKKALDQTRFTKLKITALVLKIVACCSFRLGTLTYEAQNESYGITTIRKNHVTITGAEASISFIGKKGVLNECVVTDTQCVQALKELLAVKKTDDHVMMYTVGGTWEHIRHTDINNFLKSYGENITSKDFRTFQSNMLIIDLMRSVDPNGLKPTQRKKVLNDAVKQVAAIVHNTPAVCKKDYIDPEILQLYIDHPIKYRSKFITGLSSARIMFMNWLKQKCD